jgi:cholest-4-en-3-one 26-monooxygenase
MQMPSQTGTEPGTEPGVATDVVDPDVYERGGMPHDRFAWLRDNDPVHWHPDPNESVPGFWAVTRHADIVQVSRHPEIYSSHRRLSLFEEVDEGTLELYRMMMLFQDPPEHSRNRALMNKGFTPRMVKQLEGHVRDICHGLLSEVEGRGEADFVESVAAPLPLHVICSILGVPREDADRFFAWSNGMVGFDDPDFSGSKDSSARHAADLMAYAQGLAEERRRRPGDDLATQLLQPDERGVVLTDEEFQLFVVMLVIAGNETTRNSASGGMLAFFEHPGQWERLKRDRGLMRTTPDELVRWVSPINVFRRTAVRDARLGESGTQIREGDKVVVFYGSANRDERAINDPYRFDIARDPNPHLGFGGGGPHFCLGSHVARLNLAVLFETILDRMPDIRPAGPVRRLRSNFINGLKELPVAW